MKNTEAKIDELIERMLVANDKALRVNKILLKICLGGLIYTVIGLIIFLTR